MKRLQYLIFAGFVALATLSMMSCADGNASRENNKGRQVLSEWVENVEKKEPNESKPSTLTFYSDNTYESIIYSENGEEIKEEKETGTVTEYNTNGTEFQIKKTSDNVGIKEFSIKIENEKLTLKYSKNSGVDSPVTIEFKLFESK